MKAIVHQDEDRTKAVLASLILHLGFLALFMFYKFSSPEKAIDPPPIVIEMETSTLGGGGTDAAEGEPDQGMNSAPAPVGEPIESYSEPAPPAKAEAPPQTTPTTEDPEVAALRREQAEADRKQKEEQNKIAAAERERQRIAKQEADAKAKKEKERLDKISGSGLGGSGSGSGSGGKPGNQGVPGGTGNNPSGTSGGSGGGSGGGDGTGTGTSVGGGLGNRKKLKEVPPAYNSQEQGTVRVKICVDSEGNVVEATPTQTGSSTTSGTLRSAAEKAAKQWRFAAAPGTDRQCGWIDFNFKLK